LRAHVLEGLPEHGVQRQLDAGRLAAVSFTATEIASGHSALFVEARIWSGLLPW
jgi:hypothetical protein